MIREINSSDWPAFCQQLNEQKAGATVKAEVIEPDGAKSELVTNATFQSLTFTKTEACSDTLTLRVRGTREVVQEIVEPIRILLHPSGAGDFNRLQIESESGMMFITFHPPIHPDMLAGLKPA